MLEAENRGPAPKNRFDGDAENVQRTSRESIGNCKGFSPHMAVLRRHFLTNVQFQNCMFLQGTLGYNFDIFAASGEPPLENPFKTNWREGLSCSPIRLLQHRIFDTREWTMVVFWKEDSGSSN